MEPTSLLSTILAAFASKLHATQLIALGFAVVLWWLWRDGFFRPTRRRLARRS